ncbi:uncharacterized protein V1518DRAFT_410079 [Limtongia smithiae]|uniref:uncharacterized protein n=1 Tax=Limtongia smithiae TaxID=1125753 RepID=UPI0034CF6AF5
MPSISSSTVTKVKVPLSTPEKHTMRTSTPATKRRGTPRPHVSASANSDEMNVTTRKRRNVNKASSARGTPVPPKQVPSPDPLEILPFISPLKLAKSKIVGDRTNTVHKTNIEKADFENVVVPAQNWSVNVTISGTGTPVPDKRTTTTTIVPVMDMERRALKRKAEFENSERVVTTERYGKPIDSDSPTWPMHIKATPGALSPQAQQQWLCHDEVKMFEPSGIFGSSQPLPVLQAPKVIIPPIEPPRPMTPTPTTQSQVDQATASNHNEITTLDEGQEYSTLDEVALQKPITETPQELGHPSPTQSTRSSLSSQTSQMTSLTGMTTSALPALPPSGIVPTAAAEVIPNPNQDPVWKREHWVLLTRLHARRMNPLPTNMLVPPPQKVIKAFPNIAAEELSRRMLALDRVRLKREVERETSLKRRRLTLRQYQF